MFYYSWYFKGLNRNRHLELAIPEDTVTVRFLEQNNTRKNNKMWYCKSKIIDQVFGKGISDKFSWYNDSFLQNIFYSWC